MTDFAKLRTTMVDTQVRPSDVTKYPIIEAMLNVPREAFVPEGKRAQAYVGEHVSLGGGRVVLDPRVLSKMLDAVDVQKEELVLDIGCGLGYSSALLSRMAEAVIAVEEEAYAAPAQAQLSAHFADNVVVETGELAAGAAQHGPYDVVLIEGGVETIPETILSQVKENGRICAIFVEGGLGIVRVGYKIEGNVTWRMVFNATAPVLPGFEKAREFTL